MSGLAGQHYDLYVFPLPDSAQYLSRFHPQRVDPPTSLPSHIGYTADTCMQFNQAPPYR